MERTWPGAHHMAGNARDMERVSGSPLSLYARAGVTGVLFAIAWLAGARQRRLQFLAQTGQFVGAARIAAAHRPDRRLPPADRPWTADL